MPVVGRGCLVLSYSVLQMVFPLSMVVKASRMFSVKMGMIGAPELESQS